MLLMVLGVVVGVLGAFFAFRTIKKNGVSAVSSVTSWVDGGSNSLLGNAGSSGLRAGAAFIAADVAIGLGILLFVVGLIKAVFF